MAPRASRDVFEEDVYERDRYPNGSRRDRLVEEDIDYRRRSGPPVRELERVRVRDHSAPDFLREDFTKSRDAGPLVVRREREDFEYRPRERPRPREVDREEIRIVDEERDRDRRRPVDRDVERDEIRIRRRDRSLPPLEREREEYVVRRERRSPLRSEYDRDEVIYRHSDRDLPRQTEWERDEIRYRTPSRHRSKSQHRSSSKEEIIIKKDEREGGRKRSDSEKSEIIIRKKEEKSLSPEPLPAPIDPPPIRAPPIHQEVITHHRHIDHGFEPPPPPLVRTPEYRSPRDSFEEIKIHERGERNGRSYHDDVIFDRRERDDTPPRLRRQSSAYYDRREEDEVIVSRSRPRSLEREKEIVIRERERRKKLDRRDERDIEEEADYYNRINAERSYIGEAYNGATHDWSIVDVPPGTKRVTMDGIGGASQEISWQRYNGVRRSRFMAEGEEFDEEPDRDVGRIGRRYVGVKDRHEKLWTEITKDLVVREAIERSGYEFEETEFFYYIFAYLRYDDIAALVDLSDDIRRVRRERIHEIHRERASLPPPPAPLPVRPPLMIERPPPPRPRPWEEERVSEHDLVIEERRPPRGRW